MAQNVFFAEATEGAVAVVSGSRIVFSDKAGEALRVRSAGRTGRGGLGEAKHPPLSPIERRRGFRHALKT